MTITYLKKSPKTSSTDDTKTREIVENILKQKILIFLKPKNLPVEVVLCSPLDK